MYKAIFGKNPEGVWLGFNNVLKHDEWHLIQEYDIIRVMQSLNFQYSFNRRPQILERLRFVLDTCEERNLKLVTIWGLNETIRFYVACGQRAEGYKIKMDIDSGIYRPEVKANVHTYAALLSSITKHDLSDLGRLTDLYDEMLYRGIPPNMNVEKSLINAALEAGELRLLAALLEKSRNRDLTKEPVTLQARFIAARGQAYIALYSMKHALGELEKLLSLRMPKDSRRIPHKMISSSDSQEIKIPSRLSETRDAYFIYLRSLYESIIRICIIRRQIKLATMHLNDMRANCYLPPSQMAYCWFVRYYSKRKNIDQLLEIRDMMLQDGVPLNEYVYTKLITACMFSPKPRLITQLAERVAAKSASSSTNATAANTKSAVSSSSSRINGGTSGTPTTDIQTNIDSPTSEDKSTPRKSGLPAISKAVKLTTEVAELVYHPKQCIRFLEDMLLDLNVSKTDIQDERYVPNVSITNAVMHAYKMLEQPELVLREFNRYCYHQRRQHPSEQVPDIKEHKYTVRFVFKMALGAATKLSDRIEKQRIQATMVEWGIQ
ncbi:hypothetical protein LPJ53_001521 [Coemansia erecta]|uniref:Uncharacterized protein n=1 Tax=Coemansia erecta TaxID=147472 RepID=A0A9W8CUG4_9FUNG|nr:hypothetical protein LPJ53_001521 [Coemansia erecta]